MFRVVGAGQKCTPGHTFRFTNSEFVKAPLWASCAMAESRASTLVFCMVSYNHEYICMYIYRITSPYVRHVTHLRLWHLGLVVPGAGNVSDTTIRAKPP